MLGDAVTPRLDWDIFCRVIDNLGDAGVCWRLAADLAARGQRVRLVIDDPRPLALIAPGGTAGVNVLAWPGPQQAGDVVVEAFGCDPPPAFVQSMSALATGTAAHPGKPPPVWINLEYLSAEPYVERSHGLPSPQPGGLTKWFFFPGFTSRTGGLLRESGLIEARERFDRQAWLAAQGIGLRPHERLASLFCYANAAVADLLSALARSPVPTLLLLTPGPAQDQVRSAPAGLRLHRLPWLSQLDFDRLLWSCDLNFVRGEDSLVRALWAGAPFVWQIYPQHDGAHGPKLEAMLAAARAPADVAAFWRAWNRIAPPAAAPAPAGPAGPRLPPLPALDDWRRSVLRWRQDQFAGADLVSRLLPFVLARRGVAG